MRKIFLHIILLALFSCNFSNQKVYKNLYISNGGEFNDYPVAAIRLKGGDQINIFPFEVENYKVDNKYIIFKCIDFYRENKFYLLDKDFDEYNFEGKITGPLNEKEFSSFKKKEKLNFDF